MYSWLYMTSLYILIYIYIYWYIVYTYMIEWWHMFILHLPLITGFSRHVQVAKRLYSLEEMKQNGVDAAQFLMLSWQFFLWNMKHIFSRKIDDVLPTFTNDIQTVFFFPGPNFEPSCLTWWRRGILKIALWTFWRRSLLEAFGKLHTLHRLVSTCFNWISLWHPLTASTRFILHFGSILCAVRCFSGSNVVPWFRSCSPGRCHLHFGDQTGATSCHLHDLSGTHRPLFWPGATMFFFQPVMRFVRTIPIKLVQSINLWHRWYGILTCP